MVFKRRDSRPWGRVLAEWVYPRGGWSRAFQYVRHRLHRLPGTPETIARGIFAGAVAVFTPFFGFHFVVAALIAKLMRGNIVAALLATFIGNPLTYVPIAFISLRVGHFMMGSTMRGAVDESLIAKFAGAMGDLWRNFLAIFTEDTAQWAELGVFYYDVFFPWMVGGIIPGIVTGIVAYYLSVPVIRAYQKRRSAKLRKKMEKLRAQSGVAEPRR